jgi:hypothetical protein
LDDWVGRIDEAEERRPEQDSGDELAYHGRLTESLSERSERLRGRQQRDQGDQQMRKGVIAH